MALGYPEDFMQELSHLSMIGNHLGVSKKKDEGPEYETP